jgi:hypothetical protein
MAEQQSTFATVQVLTQEYPATPAHPNDVIFVVKYPKDYKGAKTMPEGETVVSKELAEQFTGLGIGRTKA